MSPIEFERMSNDCIENDVNSTVLDSSQIKFEMFETNESNFQDPFNHYSTDFVKLDANQWLDDATDGTKMVHLDGLQFGLLCKSERQAELLAKLAPDSVNVMDFLLKY